MIVVVGYLTLKADAKDAAVAAVRELVTATRAESGNVDYRYSFDLDDETRLNLTEIWDDEDALNAHMATDHMAAFLGQVGDYVGGAVDIVRYDVSGSTKIF